MDTPIGLDSIASATVERGRALESGIGIGGHFDIECYAPDGTLKWASRAKNAVNNTALNDILNVYLRNTSAVATWYMGLIDNAGFTTLAVGDTIAAHAGWAEASGYSSGTRPTWSAGAASGQSVVNGTQVSFTMTGAASIRGAFVVSDSTKGGAAGLLFSTAAFAEGVQAVNNADVIKVTYTVPAVAS